MFDFIKKVARTPEFNSCGKKGVIFLLLWILLFLFIRIIDIKGDPKLTFTFRFIIAGFFLVGYTRCFFIYFIYKTYKAIVNRNKYFSGNYDPISIVGYTIWLIGIGCYIWKGFALLFDNIYY